MDQTLSMIMEEQAGYLQKVKHAAEKHQGIVIYGAGVYGKNLASFLRKNGLTPRSFCVSNLSGNREKEWGIPIRPLADMLREKQDDVYLIAAEPPTNQTMVQALKEHGISSYIDITPHFYQIVDPVYCRPIMEITSRVGCGMRCRFCPQDLFIKKYYSIKRPVVTSFETFKICLDKLPKDVVVDFAGFAEPFLNPAVIDMMEYAYGTGHDLRLYTTLAGLSLNSIARVLKIPFLSVVLHLPDKKHYANIPVTEDYFVMLDQFLSTAKADGQPLVDHANAQCEPPPEILEKVAGRVRVSWDMIDWAGNIETPEVRRSKKKSGKLLCAMAARQNHNILLPDGSVLLCCMDWGMNYVLGNLLTDSYESIVQGNTIKKIRSAMVDEPVRPEDFLCTSCTSAMEMDEYLCC